MIRKEEGLLMNFKKFLKKSKDPKDETIEKLRRFIEMQKLLNSTNHGFNLLNFSKWDQNELEG